MWRRKKYCEMTVWLLLKLIQKQPPEAFCTKPVLSKTLQCLQDEQVLKSLFYSGYCDIFKIPILKNICEPRCFLKCVHETGRNVKIWPVWPNGWVIVYELSGFGFESSCSHLNIFILKKGFFNINIRNEWKCLFLFHDWFPVKFVFT